MLVSHAAEALHAAGVVAVVFDFDCSETLRELDGVWTVRDAAFPTPYHSASDDDPDLHALKVVGDFQVSAAADALDTLCAEAMDQLAADDSYGTALLDLRTGNVYVTGWARYTERLDHLAWLPPAVPSVPTTLEGALTHILGVTE